jgi:hypothetical protein
MTGAAAARGLEPAELRRRGRVWESAAFVRA